MLNPDDLAWMMFLNCFNASSITDGSAPASGYEKRVNLAPRSHSRLNSSGSIASDPTHTNQPFSVARRIVSPTAIG
jgi:hypothetical protein